MIFDTVPAYLLVRGDIIRDIEQAYEVTHVGMHIDEVTPRVWVHALSGGINHTFSFGQQQPVALTRRAR